MKIFLISSLCLLFNLCIFAQKTVIVSAKKANIRETPSSNSKVVGTVAKGKELEVSENKENWYYVKFGNLRGWIHSSIISIDYTKKENLPDLSEYAIKPKQTNENVYDAFAQDYLDWVFYGKTEYGNAFYSKSRVVRNKDIVKVWTQTKDLENKNTLFKILFEVNCKSEKIRNLYQVNFYDLVSSNGKYSTVKLPIPKKIEKQTPEYLYVVPESILESLFKSVCI